MSPGSDHLVGSTVGHYQILEKLGAGGMGEVYLAENLRLKSKAALKFIAPEVFRDPARRERFVQEATLAASIDHPHVAAIYDIDQFEGRTFIAMEYVHGATVRALLKQGSLPLRRVLDISIQVADALAKVHQHGVIHRDLKPENVIVSSDGYAKVIDFGLAKPVGPTAAGASAETATDWQVRTADGLVMGTVAYMSPEQARGARLDPRSDIFSFGVLLYELLTGGSPFRRNNSAETLSAILTATPPDIAISDSAIAPELQRIVRKCLVKDADGRYQSMRDVVVDLRGVRDVVASSAPVTAATTPAAPVATHGRRLALIAAMCAVTAIAVAGWMWSRGATSPTAPGSTGRPAVAVMNFENLSGAAETAWLSAGLPSMLVTGLAQNPEIEVITADRLNEAALQVGLKQFAAIEPAARPGVVKRAGATVVVNGTIARADDELRIDARVEDLTSGRVILADTVRGRDPLALADDLAARIRRRLNVGTAEAVRPVGELSSPSLEAYRLYALGIEAANNVRTAEAMKLLKQAVDLDPNFALAHLWLYRTGPRQAERIAHLKEAARHLNRLSERDALIVEAHLAESDRRGTDALAKYQRLMDRYPDAPDGYVGAAFYFREIDRADRATEIMERAAAAMPYDGPTFNTLGYIYLADGRGPKAIEAFQKYVDLRPKEPNSLDSLAEGLLAAGDVSRALEVAQQANADGHRDAPFTIGLILAVQGRYDEALKRLLTRPSIAGVFAHAHVGRYRDAEAMTARLNPSRPGDDTIRDLLRATLSLERSNCQHALVMLAASASAGPFHEFIVAANRTGTPPQGQRRLIFDLLAGTCEARTGQLDKARMRLAEHQAVLSRGEPYPLVWLARLLEGEIALAAGDVPGAAAAFEAAGPARRLPFNRSGLFPVTTVPLNNMFLRDGLARARVAQGRVDEAIAIYRDLLSAGPESKFTAFYEPRYLLAIARLLERSGKKEEARREYSRFLVFWKHADPDLPELAEARARTK